MNTQLIIEILAAITLLLSAIYANKRHILTWPTSIISCVLYTICFVNKEIYANAFIQLIFVYQSIIGWKNWKLEKSNIIQNIKKFKDRELVLYSVLLILAYFVLQSTFNQLPWFRINGLDLFSSLVYLLATYLLINKILDSWYLFIFMDVIYIGYFFSEKLYVSSILYIILLINAIISLRNWNKQYKKI